MTGYATCPGEDCQAKVKIVEIDVDRPEPEINFCCVPCFQYTWAQISGANEPGTRHSDECHWRQLARVSGLVIEGEFKIHTPKITPPSHLGGNGGQAV